MNIPPDLKDRVARLEKRFPDVPSIFHDLFALLPDAGDEFAFQDRVEFMRTLTSVFNMVYGSDQAIEIN